MDSTSNQEFSWQRKVLWSFVLCLFMENILTTRYNNSNCIVLWARKCALWSSKLQMPDDESPNEICSSFSVRCSHWYWGSWMLNNTGSEITTRWSPMWVNIECWWPQLQDKKTPFQPKWNHVFIHGLSKIHLQPFPSKCHCFQVGLLYFWAEKLLLRACVSRGNFRLLATRFCQLATEKFYWVTTWRLRLHKKSLLWTLLK